jgi:tripartite-type tricarboxylate transporter receptor subunit TctC
MKRTIALVLILVFAFSLMACTQETPSEPVAEATEAPAESTAAETETSGTEEETVEAAVPQPDGYPSKTIDFLAPANAGAPVDIYTRGLEQCIDLAGARTSITNMGGAGQTLGTAEAAARGGDGYTIVTLGPAGCWIRPVMNEVTYSLSDFKAIAPLYDPTVPAIMVTPDSEFDTIDTLLTALKAEERVVYASAQVGSNAHIIATSLMNQIGATGAEHIAYNGGNEAAAALLGGHIEFAVLDYTMGLGYVEEGQMKMLSVLGPSRDDQTPDVPSIAEYGVTGTESFGSYFWVGMHKDTPDEIFDWVAQQVIEAVNSQEYADYLAANNKTLTPGFLTLSELDAQLQEAAETYAEAIIAAGLAGE